MRAHTIPSVLAALLAAGVASAAAPELPAVPSKAIAQDIANAPLFIVQGSNVEAALREVRSLGVEPQRKLEVIRAVAVNLTPAQLTRLRAVPGLRIYEDRQLRTSSLLSLVKSTVN